ncbi:MAG TPA: universal stress protein [Bacteroidota bacterium]
MNPKRSKPSARKKKKRSSADSIRRADSTLSLNHILVPIDFSAYSKYALQYAIPLARKFQADLLLVYVVEPTVYPADFSIGQVGYPSVEEELRSKGAEELSKLIEEQIPSGVKARKIVRTGKPYLEILDAARTEQADMIVIATHGHSGFEHLLFGSTAEKVIKKAGCPVVVIPGRV